MAIILPNTRNALGVPNRYSDLAAAGLRYTPPPVYRYDAYDVQGDTATLYEEDIDLDDYLYNEDGLYAAVVPVGYKAISGIVPVLPGSPMLTMMCSLAIADDTTLYISDPIVPSSFTQIDATTGWTKVAGRCHAANSTSVYGYAIKNGGLYAITLSHPGYTVSIVRIGDSTGWTHVCGVSTTVTSNGDYYRAWGIDGGKLNLLAGTTASQIGTSTLWTDISGFTHFSIQEKDGTVYLSWSARPLGINGGKLFGLYTNYAGIDQIGIETDWESVSGSSYLYTSPGTYTTVHNDIPAFAIRAGRLNAITATADSYPPSTTEIETPVATDWHKVTFIGAPDEAVAIRKIAL